VGNKNRRKRTYGYSQGVGGFEFEKDDPIRQEFKKAELYDRVYDVVKPPIRGESYLTEVTRRYWRIRELLFPVEPQEIHV